MNMINRIAVIGTGNVACENYFPYFKSKIDCELGCYNRNAEKARHVANQFGGVVFISLVELINWGPDVAFILTSEMAHYDIGMQLISAGVPRVFFEKPLVAAKGQAHVTESDFIMGKELFRCAQKNSTVVAMQFNYRYFDQTQLARKIISERSFGKLINVSCFTHYACWSHCIDLLHYFGGAVQELVALSGSNERSGQGIIAMDTAIGLRFKQGATGTLLGTSALSWHHPLFEINLNFERGRIQMRDIDGDLEILDSASNTHECVRMVRDASRWQHYSASFEKSLDAYFESVQMGALPPVTIMDGLLELQFEAAMRRSIANKRPVDLETEFPF